MKKKNEYSRFIQAVVYWGEEGKNYEKGKMIKMLHHCVQQDITTFESNDFEGNSIGRTFGTALSESGLSRDNIQLISKYSSSAETSGNIAEKVDKTLLDLRTDYLDLLLLDYSSQPEELLQTMEKLTSQGKVLEFGGLNLEKKEIKTLKKAFPLRANQLEPSVFLKELKKRPEDSIFNFEEVTQMVWNPVRMHLGESSSILREICTKYDVAIFQLIMAWILDHPAYVHPVLTATEEAEISVATASKDAFIDPVDRKKIDLLFS